MRIIGAGKEKRSVQKIASRVSWSKGVLESEEKLVGWEVREKREEGTKWDEMEMEREGRGETS